MKKSSHYLFLIVFLVGLHSCEKSSMLNDVDRKANTNQEVNPSAPIIGIKVKGKPYRPDGVTNRKGKECQCPNACFGLCDVEFEAGLGFVAMVDPPSGLGNHVARVWLFELPNDQEDILVDDFGIDNNYMIDVSSENYEYNNLILNTGVYNFVESTGVYSENGIDKQYFGYIDINVTTTL